ncbi:vitamin B6 photo-protection and homoeostasis-domain-containing protein [Pyrenochaeta sp. MPI-SDFR-AT-0127]|nr:vitamin B6 photo-protection and homoeostasis-domain-containing protein [Pyrenochaeta sp. MPI-SDFR-AT-0127]
MSGSAKYEIVERDEAGIITTTYLASGGSRLDVIRPKDSKSYAQHVLDVFLPAGYPQSVTEDYIQYQIYDSLQAFSSSIAGMLASRAVLEGVGVGDASASPTAALLLSVLQESMGRIATILFAHRLGTALEPECKMYRLAADIFNDTAMILDCLSPAFPKPVRVLVLGCSSILRSLCGVCAGSAKASLSAHFAKKGNLGEVNAAGSVVVSWVSTPFATWSTLIALLSIHLATNYAAVKAVSMRCLNRQRANIVFSSILEHGEVLSPSAVSKRERVFERDGVLRWGSDEIVGHCRIGVPLHTLLSRFGRRHTLTGSLDLQRIKLSELLDIFADEAYILWPASSDYEALIVLKGGCTPIDQLKAWAHALLLARKWRPGRVPGAKQDDGDASLITARLAEMRRTLKDTQQLFTKHAGALRDKGWDLNVAVLETRAGTRAEMGSIRKS